MPSEKIWSSYKPTAEFETVVGEEHEMYYEPDSGDLRIHDGSTPGGKTLTFDQIAFNITHVPDNPPAGTLCYSEPDETLDLFLENGVVLQVGQEMYGYVRNNTGNTIPNGTAVRFSGAEQNGDARLEVSPMIADGSVPTLYVFGIATENIDDGEDGKVTVWSKVRDINTNAFEVGDILYVDPDTAGALTNVKPTAPDNVIPIAAVLAKSETAGEVFVRPSFEQQKNYAEFFDTDDQTAASPNTAYSITYDSAGASQAISLVSNSRITFAESGLYNITVNAQVLSTNASAKDVRFWFRQNGVNVDNTTRLQTLTGNAEYRPFSMTHKLSVAADDYVEIMWATTDTSARLKAAPATAYAPASPSVQVIITQPAL